MLISKVEDTNFSGNKSIRIGDKLLDLSIPKVMGIINCTPDSFFEGSRINQVNQVLKKVEQFINEGVDIIDLGGYSSRPDAKNIDEKEEINRVKNSLIEIKKEFPNLIISLDTFRGNVAEIGIENGVDIINDIGSWEFDSNMFNVITKYKKPYIMMHSTGMPQVMQSKTEYENILMDITKFFSNKISLLKEHGIHDIIIDPGFGFGKTLEQNYHILNNLEIFHVLEKPLLAGISRKSMIYKKLDITPEKSLNGTTILNTLAIQKGANIIRVHDVKEAKEIVELLYNE